MALIYNSTSHHCAFQGVVSPPFIIFSNPPFKEQSATLISPDLNDLVFFPTSNTGTLSKFQIAFNPIWRAELPLLCPGPFTSLNPAGFLLSLHCRNAFILRPKLVFCTNLQNWIDIYFSIKYTNS